MTRNDPSLSYRGRELRERESKPVADTGPRPARILYAIGRLIVWAGLLVGVPLGVFGGLIGSADSVGVSIQAGVAFGLLLFAAPPIVVGITAMQASRLIRRRARTPSH